MPKVLKLSFICGLFLVPSIGNSLPPPVPVLIHQHNGIFQDGLLGYSVAGVGDLNGDGKPDYIVGEIFANPGGLSKAGSAYVYSGASGAVLYQKDGTSTFERFGWFVAGAGDVNGDGAADFIVGSPFADPNAGIPDAGSAFVYSGSNGALLYQKDGVVSNEQLGYSVAGAGDVNGDGMADFIIGVPGATLGNGSAYVYSGASGVLLYQKDGASGDNLGYSVAGAGDVNGDGRADFIVGAPATDPGGENSAGSAYVYSGATGALLYQKDGAAADDNFGRPVAGAGDVNGDGKSDFIIGAIGAGPSFTGSAYVYSGATGVLLYQKNGTAGLDTFGESLAGVGDVNCDGKADFIIGAPGTGFGFTGSAYVYSGATGVLFYQKDGAAAGDNLGFSVSGAGGDINGDGGDDFIIGAPGADPSGIMDAGTAFVYSLYGPCTFPSKGDMDGSGNLSPADVVLMLNCVFLASGNCDLSFADVDCSGGLSPADVVLELNAVFLEAPFPC